MGRPKPIMLKNLPVMLCCTAQSIMLQNGPIMLKLCMTVSRKRGRFAISAGSAMRMH